MYCPTCGQEIADDVKTCPFCGAPVETESPAVPEAIAPAETSEADEMSGFTPTQTKLLIRAMALLCYLGPFFFFPMFAMKDKKWLRQHVNNGLVLFIFTTGASIFSAIPIIGWIGGSVLLVFCLIIMIQGIIRSVKGLKYDMPWFFGDIKIVK